MPEKQLLINFWWEKVDEIDKSALFYDENNLDENVENQIDESKKWIENVLFLDFLTCPNCESQYLENSWCSKCWYLEKIPQDFSFPEKIQNILWNKSKYKSLWILKYNTEKNRERELKIDLNNFIITTKNATIYAKIWTNKHKFECDYSIISQQDEYHRIDNDVQKIIHNLNIKPYLYEKSMYRDFRFEKTIYLEIKKLLNEFLNDTKYNKNL